MKVRRLKKLMIEAISEHNERLKECQREIHVQPSKAYHVSLKMAGIMNQIENCKGVLEVCETLNDEDSILKSN